MRKPHPPTETGKGSDGLQAFTAQAHQQKAALAKRPGSSKASASAAPSGFARLEALLDGADTAATLARLQSATEALAALESGGKSLRERAAGKRGQAALSHAFTALEQLFSIKNRLWEAQQSAPGAAELAAEASAQPPMAAAPAIPAENEAVASALIPLTRRDLALLLEVGYLLLEMRRFAPAQAVFSGVSHIVPSSEVPLMALGNLYFAMGRLAPALKAHQQALAKNPQSPAVHAALAETLFFSGKVPAALEHLQKTLLLEEKGPAADFARALKEAYDSGVFASPKGGPQGEPSER